MESIKEIGTNSKSIKSWWQQKLQNNELPKSFLVAPIVAKATKMHIWWTFCVHECVCVNAESVLIWSVDIQDSPLLKTDIADACRLSPRADNILFAFVLFPYPGAILTQTKDFLVSFIHLKRALRFSMSEKKFSLFIAFTVLGRNYKCL